MDLTPTEMLKDVANYKIGSEFIYCVNQINGWFKDLKTPGR